MKHHPRKLLHVIALTSLITSCSSYRSTEQLSNISQRNDRAYSLDSLHNALHTRDTLLLRDTLRMTIVQKGDTIYNTTERVIYRDRVKTVNDTAKVLITRTDTITIAERETQKESIQTNKSTTQRDKIEIGITVLLTSITCFLLYKKINN